MRGEVVSTILQQQLVYTERANNLGEDFGSINILVYIPARDYNKMLRVSRHNPLHPFLYDTQLEPTNVVLILYVGKFGAKIITVRSRRMRWVGHLVLGGQEDECVQGFCEKQEETRPLGKLRRWWKNIKISIMEIGCDGV